MFKDGLKNQETKGYIPHLKVVRSSLKPGKIQELSIISGYPTLVDHTPVHY